jgi:hypothetical protein
MCEEQPLACVIFLAQVLVMDRVRELLWIAAPYSSKKLSLGPHQWQDHVKSDDYRLATSRGVIADIGKLSKRRFSDMRATLLCCFLISFLSF